MVSLRGLFRLALPDSGPVTYQGPAVVELGIAAPAVLPARRACLPDQRAKKKTGATLLCLPRYVADEKSPPKVRRDKLGL